MIHSFADHALTCALNVGLLFREGFGDHATLDHITRSIATFTPARDAGEVRMRPQGRALRVPGGECRLAVFESPAPTPMPMKCRTARVQIWTPTQHASGAMCIQLAATGDEGFRRRESFAQRLLAHGIGSLVLENPFYGSRRPYGQYGPLLRTVVDQFAMSTAMVDEARALLTWARRSGYVPGVTGYSLGGFMAAFAAAFVDFPVVCVPRAAGTNAAPVLTEWVLRRVVHWPALAREAGSLSQARADLARHLSVVDLTKFPPPVAPALATVMTARHDRFFPLSSGIGLHQHWPGSKLIISNASHVTSVFLDSAAHVEAVVEAFRRAAAIGSKDGAEDEPAPARRRGPSALSTSL